MDFIHHLGWRDFFRILGIMKDSGEIDFYAFWARRTTVALVQVNENAGSEHMPHFSSFLWYLKRSRRNRIRNYYSSCIKYAFFCCWMNGRKTTSYSRAYMIGIGLMRRGKRNADCHKRRHSRTVSKHQHSTQILVQSPKKWNHRSEIILECLA